MASTGLHRVGSGSRAGLVIAVAVVSAWAVHLVWRLSVGLTGPVDWVAAFLVQTYLCTGLFITAHDAMHGTVAPAHPRLNNAIGALCLFLYAGFNNYEKMRRFHHEHHRVPGVVDEDPDFHDGRRTSAVGWYFTFMFRYFGWGPLVVQAVLFNVLTHGLGLPQLEVLSLVGAPAIVSSIQLFFFGTYLTHRVPSGGHTHPDNAVSSDFPPWLSLLTCYHFGYHEEHHESPQTPWWRLPGLRHQKVSGVGTR